MTDSTNGASVPSGESGGPEPDNPMIEEGGSKRGLTIFVGVVVLIALAIAAVLAIEAWQSDDDDNLVAPDTSLPSSTSTGSQPTLPESTPPASSEPPAPTTAPETTAAPEATAAPETTAPQTATTAPTATTSPPQTTIAPEDLLRDAVWPHADSDIRYDDPVAAARGFAVDFIGFVAPAIGEFQPIDEHSGEIDLRVGEAGPATIVFVSQSPDDTWWVTGSQSDNIVVQRPDALETVASPMTITGLARAFEGTVNVELRADGVTDPLVEGFVTGGSGPDLQPFEETFEFDSPGEGGGSLLMLTYSPDNGQVLEAQVIRVFFAAG